MKAGTVKHKLGARTVKYKFGSETGARASAGGREAQIPSELTHSKTMFLSNRNQSIDFHSKMIHCFLCESGIWTVVLNWSIKSENNELIWCLFLKFEWKFAHWKSIYLWLKLLSLYLMLTLKAKLKITIKRIIKNFFSINKWITIYKIVTPG